MEQAVVWKEQAGWNRQVGISGSLEGTGRFGAVTYVAMAVADDAYLCAIMALFEGSFKVCLLEILQYF